MEGWIKLYRKMLNWEWYTNTNTKVLFIHLLLLANHEDNYCKGQLVKRGQLITSYNKLSKELQQTIQQTRTALNNLKSTHDITVLSTKNYTLITIEKYDKFQAKEEKITQLATQPTTQNQQRINTQSNTQNNNKQEYKEIKNIYINLLNKYKGQNLKTFFGKMKFYNLIKEDEIFKKLNPEEEYELKNMILGGN